MKEMNKINDGKKWVSGIFHEKSHKKGVFVKVDCEPTKSLKLEACAVAITYNQKSVIVQFKKDDLENWKNKKVQERLSKRIQLVVDSLIWQRTE